MNTGPLSDPDVLTFALFNPALGTLNSVKITFTSAFNATATLLSATNGNADVTFVQGNPVFDSVDFFADGTLTIKLTSSGGQFPDQTPLVAPTVEAACLDVQGPGDSQPPVPGTCTNHQNSTSGNFDSPSPDGIPNLTTGPFMGPGSFAITANLTSALAPRVDPDNKTMQGDETFADNATFSGLLTSLLSGSVTVSYDYTASSTAIPEPVTLYLLLAGLGGIALVRRRRR